MAVAHRLAERDDVGHDAVALEAPHLPAGAAEARLHLVGDEEPAGLAHFRDRLLQEAGRIREDAVARKDRVDDQRRRLDAVGPHVVDRASHMPAKAAPTSCPLVR